MAELDRPQILLTNDDGILSPGLWAAAEALSRLGFVNVAAPREQSSGAGRSMPPASDGAILEDERIVGEKAWKVYAVGGTPALAISLETHTRYHLTHSEEIDFSAAAHFTHLFAGMILRGMRLRDVDVLKVDVPSGAPPQTKWRVTRLSRVRYFVPIAPQRERLELPGGIGYRVDYANGEVEEDSDIYAVQKLREVAVTPLSIDLTSRVRLGNLEAELRRLAG